MGQITTQAMKNKLHKAGSVCMIVLGVLHTLYFIFSVISNEPVIYDTLANVTKKGVAWFLGERSLLSYYNGYSLSMGLLLVSYGLLAIITKHTCKTAVLSLIISAAAFIISAVYFHVLAYTIMALSVIFYSLSLLTKERTKTNKAAD